MATAQFTLTLYDVVELDAVGFDDLVEVSLPEISRGRGEEEVRQVGSRPSEGARVEIAHDGVRGETVSLGVERVAEGGVAVPGLAVQDCLEDAVAVVVVAHLLRVSEMGLKCARE